MLWRRARLRLIRILSIRSGSILLLLVGGQWPAIAAFIAKQIASCRCRSDTGKLGIFSALGIIAASTVSGAAAFSNVAVSATRMAAISV